MAMDATAPVPSYRPDAGYGWHPDRPGANARRGHGDSGLTDTLVSLRNRLGGALAVVTGRSIETVDRLLGAAPGAVAGEHGGAIRHAA